MSELKLGGFVQLAHALRMPLILFDFETTTFRGRPNFGIMEAAFMMAVNPQGAGAVIQYGSLVNPEALIDRQVSELTGITQSMVTGHKPWSDSYMQHMYEFSDKAYFTGFNSDSFDLPAAQDQAKRYNAVPPDFKHHFDVRKLHLKLSNATSQKGKLADVAAIYGVKPRGHLHRASADVALTAETLSVMVLAYGLEKVLGLIAESAPEVKQEGAVLVHTPGEALTAENVARYVRSGEARSLAALAKAFGTEEHKVSFEAGKALDSGLIPDPGVFADEAVQAWLVPAVVALPANVRDTGKLKNLYVAVEADNGKRKGFDYIQLRIAMLRNGMRWATLKAA